MSESNQSNLKAPTRKAFHFPKGVDAAAVPGGDDAVAPAKGARAAVKKSVAVPPAAKADAGVTKAAKATKAGKPLTVQAADEASTKKPVAKKSADGKAEPKKAAAGKTALDKPKAARPRPVRPRAAR